MEKGKRMQNKSQQFCFLCITWSERLKKEKMEKEG